MVIYILIDMAVIIDEICIRKGEVCQNPLYLTWKNTLGGWDYWLFQYRQSYGLLTTSTGDFQRYYDDISSQDTVTDWIKKNGVETILLGSDDLSLQEVRGIQDIFYSPKVYLFNGYVGSPQVPQWKTVLIEPNSIELFESSRNVHELSFEIRLPELYTLSN